ncbi:F-box domain-containing protein [Mycena venus]|uniref:F-box domain-containing protein n=1 Tax=Mycena venus TaxID=2733690 RepID=A0A8H6XIL3_9AGAR|nr:F-box domain-containing protein [Mycena venus]
MTVPDTVPAASGSLDATQETQIRELLRSHLPLPSHLPSTLSSLADRLAQYDVEITSLQKKLDRLRSERAAFQKQYEDCNSLLAPIRRLPSEILVGIFGMCENPWRPIIDSEDLGSITLATAMSRLAHAPIMILSQVCVRWHSIALDTPALWSQIDLDGQLWIHPDRDSVMKLLRSALERSAHHPLTVTITNFNDESPFLPALQLLAQHSVRWKTATFLCPFSDLVNLSMLKGNLPNLEELEMHCWDDKTERMLELFQDVPRLKFVYFMGNDDGCTARFPLLPLKQLGDLWYIEAVKNEPPTIIAHLSRLSRATWLRLQLSLDAHDPERGFPPIGGIVSSGIRTIMIEIYNFRPIRAQQTLEFIFASITLPSLTQFAIRIAASSPQLHLPIPWPHVQFLSLSERSSFPTHLLELNLYHVVIPEAELLQVLAALTSLKRLSITDQVQLPINGSVEHALITDTLLTALTRTPDSPCLVPDLVRLHCKSLLRFDDDVFLEFILSRVRESPGSPPFECELWWLPGHGRQPDPLVAEQLRELQTSGKLAFSFVQAKW